MRLDEMGDPVLQASVIICAHNPRSDYFARVLASLRDQTLPFDNWELLIVDNASKVPLARDWQISWHPTARHIMEAELGVAAARRRGIREACADLIVFVDDDNVLDETYLSQAVAIAREWPLLGAWGSGSIKADFEVEPAGPVRQFLPYLALRETASPQWSNVTSCLQAMPWGAGLCVRRPLGIAYCQSCERSSIQIKGRVGTVALSGEDKEITIVCCTQGFGFGIFPELRITHLIPRHRVSEKHITRLVEGNTISDLLLDYKWLNKMPESPGRLQALLSFLKTILLYRGIERRNRWASARAQAKAIRIIEADLKKNKLANGEINGKWK
jgi:glycosyltransferase involved in cell wall biosynthesis